MENNDYVFSSLSGAPEEKIYADDDYSLIITGNGDVECQHSCISNVYHEPSVSANSLSVAQLTKT